MVMEVPAMVVEFCASNLAIETMIDMAVEVATMVEIVASWMFYSYNFWV